MKKPQFVQVFIKSLLVVGGLIAGWILVFNHLISKSSNAKSSNAEVFLVSLSSKPQKSHKKHVILCRETPSNQLVSVSQKTLPVFKKDGSLQCDNKKNHSFQIMTYNLKKLNVKILKSSKGHLISSRQLSVCGSPTNHINIFYVPTHQASLLFEKGFKSCIKSPKSPKKSPKY